MAQNDPQWGKKGNDGPPDLDEILRKMMQKLSGFFGGSNGGNPLPDNSAKLFAGGAGLLGLPQPWRKELLLRERPATNRAKRPGTTRRCEDEVAWG